MALGGYRLEECRLIFAQADLPSRAKQLQAMRGGGDKTLMLYAHHTGIDHGFVLYSTQADLREKAKQLQAIRGELDMRHAQVDDQKFSIKRMQVCNLFAMCQACCFELFLHQTPYLLSWIAILWYVVRHHQKTWESGDGNERGWGGGAFTQPAGHYTSAIAYLESSIPD